MVRRGDPGRRVGITLLAIAVMLTLFAGRLVQIQGLDSGYYKNAANQEKLKKIVLPALRGTIYSSNNQVLAMTTETYKITADPPQMKAAELPTVAQQLSGPLGLPAAKILSLLQHPTSTEYVQLASGVSVANDEKIEALKVYDAGIYDDASYAMAYPDGEATANVVGFANVNPQTGVIAGQAGVEQEYNKLLTGTTGSEEYLRGPQRPADPRQPGGDAGPERRLDQADDQLRPPVRRDERVPAGGRQVAGEVVHGRHHPAEDRRHPRHGPVADLGPEHAGPRHRAH